MENTFLDSVDVFLTKHRQSFVEPIRTSDLQLVTSLCNLMECLIKPGYGFKDTGNFDKKKKYY
jgi:hypothetical protein